MRHNIRLDGYGFRLRPIELGDAPLIIELRGDQNRTRHLHPIPLDVTAQETYLQRYFERPDEYYFVIERHRGLRRPEGLISIYDLDPTRRRAEWGRWIIAPRSLAALESAWLIYRVAFDRLDLDEVFCHTLVDNSPVLSFHDRAGLERSRRINGLYEIGGRRHDVIEHVLTRDRWRATDLFLRERAQQLAGRMRTTT
jgi:RimJ/RimL family protein N-acetyltransferase